MINPVREELLKRLYFLTVTEWPVFEHELVTRETADSLLMDNHVRSFHKIKVLANADAEAAAFVRDVYAAISRPHVAFDGTYYDPGDVIKSARQLAPSFFRRLQREKQEGLFEEKLDPVATAKREYLKSRSEFDPFCADANVAVEGLPEIPKPQVRIDPMDGSVITDF